MGSPIAGPCGGVASGGGKVGDGLGPAVPLALGSTVPVPAAGVCVPLGCTVPAAPGTGVGVGGRIGMVSTCPSARALGSAMLFARTISSRVTPKRLAISQRVSPALTVYFTGATVAAAGAVWVGVATGVSTNLTRSPVLAAAPLHPATQSTSRAENATLANERGEMRDLNFEANRFNLVCRSYGVLLMPVWGIVGRLPPGCWLLSVAG